MKIQQQNEMVASGLGETIRFKMETNAKAFQILSSNLYSNKLGSILREIASNAIDSHIQAGKTDTPFTIRMPSYVNMNLEIEDYGVGLSEQELIDVYTSYFTSTKTDTNSLIGGFGLGSKSPFAYTDIFNVRARKDGKEVNLLCMLNNEGAPSFSITSRKDTDQCNGVCVIVPIQTKSDAEQLHKELWQLRCVSVPFDIQTVTEYNREVHKLTKWNARYKQRGRKKPFFVDYKPDMKWYNEKTVYVVIGGIPYNIDVKQNYELKEKVCKLHDYVDDLYIDVNIGDFDLNAGREALSYDSVTVQKLNDTLADVIKKNEAYTDSVFNDSRANLKRYFENLKEFACYKEIAANAIKDIDMQFMALDLRSMVLNKIHHNVKAPKNYAANVDTLVRWLRSSHVFIIEVANNRTPLALKNLIYVGANVNGDYEINENGITFNVSDRHIAVVVKEKDSELVQALCRHKYRIVKFDAIKAALKPKEKAPKPEKTKIMVNDGKEIYLDTFNSEGSFWYTGDMKIDDVNPIINMINEFTNTTIRLYKVKKYDVKHITATGCKCVSEFDSSVLPKEQYDVFIDYMTRPTKKEVKYFVALKCNDTQDKFVGNWVFSEYLTNFLPEGLLPKCVASEINRDALVSFGFTGWQEKHQQTLDNVAAYAFDPARYDKLQVACATWRETGFNFRDKKEGIKKIISILDIK